MNGKFTSKTYGEVRYVVEDGVYRFPNQDIAVALNCANRKLGNSFDKYQKAKGDFHFAKFDGKKYRLVDLEGVEHYCSHAQHKEGRRERAMAFCEWLKGQVESARNGAPCVPEPVETEQPTEQGDFLPDFHSCITRLTRKRDECQRTINICESVFMQAAAWKKGWDDISAKYAEQKAQNATLQAQVDELQQQLSDGDITDIVNNNTKLRYMLGESELKRYEKDYRYNRNDILRYQNTYCPTQMADFVKNMSKFSMHLSAQVVNKKLIEAGYQEQNGATDGASYQLTPLLDDSYAYVVTTKGNNGADIPTLQWTKKGLALFIGLLLDTEAIEGTCI